MTTDVPDVTVKAIMTLLPVLKFQTEKLNRSVRLIIVSSMGLGKSHQDLPLLLKPVYGWLLHNPHQNKEVNEFRLFLTVVLKIAQLDVRQCLEELCCHAAGIPAQTTPEERVIP